jgi:hypothetical protein
MAAGRIRQIGGPQFGHSCFELTAGDRWYYSVVSLMKWLSGIIQIYFWNGSVNRLRQYEIL